MRSITVVASGKPYCEGHDLKNHTQFVEENGKVVDVYECWCGRVIHIRNNEWESIWPEYFHENGAPTRDLVIEIVNERIAAAINNHVSAYHESEA